MTSHGMANRTTWSGIKDGREEWGLFGDGGGEGFIKISWVGSKAMLGS